MKKLLLISSLFFITIGVFAQEKKDRFNHSLGFGAGVSTGYGLSYRYFGGKLGVQVNFSPYKDETKVIMSSGVTFLFRLVELEKLSFYAYQANHFYYEKESYTYTEYDYEYSNGTTITTANKVTYLNEQKYFNNGAGIGLEFTPSKRISLNVMGGYGGQKDFRKISFTGETAIYFKF